MKKSIFKVLVYPVKLVIARMWWFSLLLIMGFNLYWGWIATDRFVSSTRVVLQSPDIAPPELSFSAMLTNGSAQETADMLLLREYLMSAEVLKTLDAKLDLRHHYAQKKIDFLSRLENPYLPLEKFHEYYLKRIDIRLDDYSGVLIIEAQAFDQKMALALVLQLMKLGEQHMNQMGQRLATEQVKFIEQQVAELAERLNQATQAVLSYQDREGMLSPSETAASISALIAQLNAELVKLKAERSALASFQSPRSAEMIRLKSQISSLQKQIDIEKSKLTAFGGEALNKISSEYEELKLKAQFAQELYANALATLEATRVEAARKLKQLSVLSAPYEPEYSIAPDRSYLMVLSTVLILLITFILYMIVVIVKDHRD